jgi:hypothetical protein
MANSKSGLHACEAGGRYALSKCRSCVYLASAVRWPSGRRRRFAKRRSAFRPPSFFLANASLTFLSPIGQVGCCWPWKPRFGAPQGQSWGQQLLSGPADVANAVSAPPASTSFPAIRTFNRGRRDHSHFCGGRHKEAHGLHCSICNRRTLLADSVYRNPLVA